MATMGVCITFLLILLLRFNDNGVQATWEENMDIDKKLNILNKEPVKSIQAEADDIFDCIDIYKQPAFDHPLLKNHTIQMEPTFSLKNNLKEHSRTILKRINCPKETVPIRRTRREDLVRAKHLMEQHFTNIHPLDAGAGAGPGNSRAILRFESSKLNGGADGFMNVINPKVENDQTSSALIFVMKGTAGNGDYSGIQAGWTVSPGLYGDSKTRLITRWENYNGGTLTGGCFNDLCLGFVHVNNEPPLNLVMTEVSEYDGESYGISISIVQDKTTKNWWLTYQGHQIGYWPNTIISHLTDGADQVAWGGVTNASPSNGISPPMGFGTFPDENFTHSGFFGQINVIDKNGTRYAPAPTSTNKIVDHDNCYKMGKPYFYREPAEGLTFSYGGPGGKCAG